ncbi:PREDICTED: uncharacterized protein LOC104802424 isoform X2 [Tarenaya hassleriana]|uniref:uncharacterized protein LOC104802424 isoform X2 n=1 Tax=Tarenaya hassleriana TaxID=28532 RepID=UPI00053C3071|nr:PREDICTED: uncharacterized protein LOC104802424 isoform X2 [Tarenaya hassleriana]
MALLSSCWLIIESIIIQDSFLKWTYMKVYVNPVFLFLCQVLLWLSMLYLWLLRHFRLFYDTVLWILAMFHKQLIRFVLFIRRDATRVESRQVVDIVNMEISRKVHSFAPVFYSHNFFITASNKSKVIWVQENEILEEEEEEEEENEAFEECEEDGAAVQLLEEDDDAIYEKNMKKDLELECRTSEENGIEEEESSTVDDGEDDNAIDEKNMDKDLEPECRTSEENGIEEEESSSVDDGEDTVTLSNKLSTIDTGQMNSSTDSDDQSSPFSDLAVRDPIDENDEVYEQYSKRMRWYDILNQDRTLGLSMIMNQKTARNLNSSSWDKTAEKRLRESVERDLELVYVAQSCLSWEALRHQYMKIREMAESADSGGGFSSDLCGDLQRFQVLLERFLEDERCDRRRRRRRVMRFVQRRFELMSFFQVPKISGHRREGGKGGGVGAGEALRAIERCTQVFHEFVKSDVQKPCWWGLHVPSRVEVEDPRDIKLFLSLSDSLHKEQLLKKKKKNTQQGKNKSTMGGFGEQQEEMMMMEIELKIVRRVLQMPLISSSHLKWCQHKLDSIHFNDANINYSSSLSPFLFPSS